MNFIELTTERLHLRVLKDKDAQEIQFLRSDPVVNKFVERKKTETIIEAINYIKRIQKSVYNKEVHYWCICLKGNPQLIGTICLWNFSKDLKKAEVGYDLHPDFHGRGIMSESLDSVLDFGFNKLNLINIEAYTQFDNAASVNLLKKKKFKLIDYRVDNDNPKNKIFIIKKEDF